MSINALMVKNNSVVEDAKLIHAWESVLPIIHEKNIAEAFTINTSEADRFIFDFYGLLQYLNVPSNFFYPTMRANGLKTPTEYDGVSTSIKVINSEFLTMTYATLVS